MNYTIIQKDKFNEMRSVEGYVLTSYIDGDDILEYYSTTVICAPKAVDIEHKYRVITVEEDAELQQLKEQKMEELDKERLEAQ